MTVELVTCYECDREVVSDELDRHVCWSDDPFESWMENHE